MFRKKDEAHSANDQAAPEETAYEDNWYRSLKALSEQRDEPTETREPAVEAAPVEPPAEAPLPVEVATEVPASVEVATEAPAVAPAGPPDAFEPEAFETRAGRLLERLRTLQSLSDPDPEPASDTEESSTGS